MNFDCYPVESHLIEKLSTYVTIVWTKSVATSTTESYINQGYKLLN
jgi:hypothetical protein